MTRSSKPKPPDTLIDKLEHAITRILANPKATQKEKNAAIANGVKLAHIKFRISPESTEEFFGTESE
jgi:hypothetical protein